MADEKTEEAPKKKGKGLLVPAVVLAIGLLGGGYFFMSSSKSSGTPTAPTTTTTALGKIVALDPITMNLSDGHVLKVGLSLQLVAKPKSKEIAAAVSGGGGEGASKASTGPLGGEEAKALDLAIKTLGDMSFEELSKPGGRAKAKADLTKEIEEAYESDIVGVYFTTFVMS